MSTTGYVDQRRVIGIRTETSQGAGATFSATDYIIGDVEFPELNIEKLDRNWHRISYSTLPHIIGKRTVKVKVRTELKGSGTAGTAYTPLGAALQACGFNEAVQTGTSVTYAPLTASVSGFLGPGRSCALNIFLGGGTTGQRYTVKGCVGNFEITAEINKIPIIEFDFEGEYEAPATADFPSVTYIATLPVVWQNSTIAIHGFNTANVRRWKINSGNKIQLLEDSSTGKSGIGGFFISGREPSAEAEIIKVGLATFNPISILAGGATATSSFTIGATAGNIITANMSRSQMTDVKIGSANDRMTDTISFALRQNTGDDELTLVFT